MFNRSRALLAAALIGAISFAPALGTPPSLRPTLTVSKKHKRGGAVHPSSPSLSGISALRISVAQGKRNAAKRRNQRRHKRHLRR